MYENTNLFTDEAVDSQTKLNESTERGQDGLYRIDMDKVSHENKKRGYRAVLRFLPNLVTNPDVIKAVLGDAYTGEEPFTLGPSLYRKISHYLKFENENLKDAIGGYFDDPTNINPYTQKPHTTDKWGPLATTYFTLDKSKDAMAQERAKHINYSNKYYSYVLVIEDEQQPELEGKIMIFSYGKQIKDIIDSEDNGDMGQVCNIFKPHNGKDFVLLAKPNEFTMNGETIESVEYTKSRFNSTPQPTQVSKITEDGKVVFKRLETDLETGQLTPKSNELLIKFLQKREHELESFCGKAWTPEQKEKADLAISYLLGKISSNDVINGGASNAGSSSEARPNDFSFDDAGSDSDDDFSSVSDDAEVELDDDFDFD